MALDYDQELMNRALEAFEDSDFTSDAAATLEILKSELERAKSERQAYEEEAEILTMQIEDLEVEIEKIENCPSSYQ